MSRRPASLSTMQLAVVCFSTTVLVFVGELRFLMAPASRFYLFWQRSDAVVLTLMIIGIAGIATGVALWARAHSPRVSAVLRGMFVLVLAEVLLAIVVRSSPQPPFWLSWLLPVAVLGLAAGVHVALSGALYRLGLAATLVLSPLGVILLLQLLHAPSVDLRETVPEPTVPRGTGPPIVLLILDEWSYSRSTRGGQFIASMPRLRELAGRVTFFTEAHSPAGATFRSLRSIFAESMRGNEVRDLEWWYGDPTAAESPVRPRLFQRAQQLGYRSQIIGYYLPYRELVGDVASQVRTETHFPKGQGVLARMGWIGLRVLTRQGDPFTRFLATRLDRELFNRYWFDLNLRVEARIGQALRHTRQGQLIVGHLPLPHSPFVFAANGRFQPDSVESTLEFSPAKYAVHLAYLDLVAGRLLDSLAASGQYDSSLVIITSDHSWKVDWDALEVAGEAEMRHVPLMVHWPGQRQGKVVREPVCLLGLGALMSSAQEGGGMPVPPDDALHELASRSCASGSATEAGRPLDR